MATTFHSLVRRGARRLGVGLLAPVLVAGALTAGSGAGAASLNVTFTATSINFGSVTVGTTASGQITVTNTTSVALALKSAIGHGGDVSDFAVSPSGCSGTIAAGATCDIGVVFAPGAPVQRTSSVAVTLGTKGTNGQFTATSLVQANVSGVGVAPSVSLSDASAGTVARGSTGVAAATLTNTSSVPLTIKNWGLQGDVADEFAISSVACPSPLGPGQSCDVLVVFRPAAPGAAAVTLNVDLTIVGASSSKVIHVQSTVSGTGSTTSGAQPLASVLSLNVGTVTVGTSASGEVAVTNTSSGTLLVKKFAIGGNAAKEFVAGTWTCSAGLAVGASCEIPVTFTPVAPGLRNATIGVVVVGTINAKVVTRTVQATLSGTGQRPSIALSATDAGPVTIGASSVAQVVVSNTSLAPLAFHSAVLVGPHLPSWTVSSTTCAGPLSPGASCEVNLSFAPHTAGNLSIQLNTVFDIKVAHRVVAVLGQTTVAGTGVQPTFSVSAPSFAATTRGVAVSGVATVTNTSGVALSYQQSRIGGANPLDFTVTGTTCVAQVAPTASCQLTISFDPLQVGAGTRSAVVSVAMIDDGVTPVHTVSLATAISAQEN